MTERIPHFGTTDNWCHLIHLFGVVLVVLLFGGAWMSALYVIYVTLGLSPLIAAAGVLAHVRQKHLAAGMLFLQAACAAGLASCYAVFIQHLGWGGVALISGIIFFAMCCLETHFQTVAREKAGV